MSEITQEQIKQLLLKRREGLLLLSKYRTEIEAMGRGRVGVIPRNALAAVCSYIAGDFNVFIDGDIVGETKVPAGDVEISDVQRQQFAIEVWCDADIDARIRLEEDLAKVLREAIDKEPLSDRPIRNGGRHFNNLHRVAAVIEYP